MTNDPIDELLRRDAAAWDASTPPSLDDALDAAARTARRTPGTWLAVAAAVAVIAAAASGFFATRGDNSPSSPAAGSSSGTPLATDSSAYVLRPVKNFGLEGAVLDVSDSTVVDLLVQQNIAGDRNPCEGTVDPQATVTAQNADAVDVEVTGQGYLPRPKHGSKYVGFSCSGTGTLVSLQVTLDRPLGSRTLRAGDQKLVVLPATAPVPAYLPAGSNLVFVDHPDPPHSLVAATTYNSVRGRRGAYRPLVVREGPSDELVRGSNIRGHATVDGRRATFMGGRSGDEGDPLCLTWSTGAPKSELGEIARQVCVDVLQPDTPATLRHQILRVARSLP